MFQIERRPVVVLAGTILISIPIMPTELWLIKTLVDNVQMWRPLDPVGPIVVTAGWLAVLMFVNNIGLGFPLPMAMTRLQEIAELEKHRLLLQKTARLPLTAVESPVIKDLRERAKQISLYDIYNSGIHLLQSLLQTTVLLVIMLAFGQWLPTVAVCAAAFLLSYVSGKSAESIERLGRKQTADRRLLRHYADLMTNREAAKEIRLFGLHRLLAERWTSLFKQQSRETQHAVYTSELRKLGPELLMALLSGLLIALLVLLPGAVKLTAGDFSLLFMTLTMLLSQITGLINQAVSMRTQYMRWEDFSAYLKLEDDRNGEHSLLSATINPAISLHLQVYNLGYRYPGADKPALSGVSFTIPPGCRAAVVGQNGSGKSTLVKLLTGLYTPQEGHIIWRDGEGNGLSNSDLRGNASAVFQDFTRLSITLRENVALGRLSQLANDSKLQTTLHSVGSRLNNLDGQIGAAFGGIEPSGGEWQRIVTARALLRDATFVFFDEPTAALDPQAEKQAFDLFLRVTQGRSALLVTHRLGAAKLADIIYVMKEGRLVEWGTHDELIRQDGEYSHMFQLQAAWYL